MLMAIEFAWRVLRWKKNLPADKSGLCYEMTLCFQGYINMCIYVIFLLFFQIYTLDIAHEILHLISVYAKSSTSVNNMCGYS